MKDKQRLVSLFYFNDNIAGKDMFLAPKYLANELGLQGEIVFPIWTTNAHLKGEYRGVKLTPIKSKSRFDSTLWSEKEIGWWLIKNACKIDVLFLFWFNTRNLLFAKIYKILNPKGICYIKGDFNEIDVLALPTKVLRSPKQRIKEWFYQAIDVVSAETQKAYYHIKNGAMGQYMANIVEYVPNAFDIELCKRFDIKRKGIEEKDDLVITVGRIGHVEKNNEMMLDALSNISMNGWKFIFIGPIEPDFSEKYNRFITQNPDKKDSVLLYGKVNDKQELWELYNKAKVFVLTSPKEGFPNVFPEALSFGNYIITTSVGSTFDVTNDGKIGKIISINDTKQLSNIFLNIFEHRTDIESVYPNIIEHSMKFRWDKAIIPVSQRIKEMLCR